MPPSIPIARSKTAALTRVLDSIPKGYGHYVAGRCRPERLLALAQKFHERYGIGCTPAQRVTRKKRGQANALLVVYLPPEVSMSEAEPTEEPANAEETAKGAGTDEAKEGEEAAVVKVVGAANVDWLLLVTPGEGDVRAQEALRSVTDARRLVWLGYELVRHQVRGRTSWTWRRPKAEMAELYALLTDQLGRQQDGTVGKTLTRVARQPGFAGVRAQSWDLCAFARQRGYGGELPHLYFVEKGSHGERLVL